MVDFRFLKRNLAERDLEDFLNNRRSQLLAEREATKSSIEASREKASQSLQNLSENVSNRFGIEDTSKFAAPFFEDVKKGLSETSEQELVKKNLDNRRKSFIDNFNFAIDRYVNAGIDRQEAEANATQFALDEDERQYKSGILESKRQFQLKKQAILDQYSDVFARIKRDAEEEVRKDLFKKSIIRELLSFGATIGTSLAIRGISNRGSGSSGSGTVSNSDLGGTSAV